MSSHFNNKGFLIFFIIISQVPTYPPPGYPLLIKDYYEKLIIFIIFLWNSRGKRKGEKGINQNEREKL